MRSAVESGIVGLFIDGRWRLGRDGRTLPVRNPADETVVAQVAAATISDLDEALAASARVAPAWWATQPANRGAILARGAELLEQRREMAAYALTREQGKPLREAHAEITRAVETLRWHAQAAAIVTDERPLPQGVDRERRVVVPEPIGVVAAFTPWNYPIVIAARKLGAALAAGCPAILKAAEETPSAVAVLVSALHDAGAPEGVVNLVFGEPAQISEYLLSASSIVRALSFTGSTAIGKQLAARAAGGLTRCVLELGGHAPVLVFDDADLEAAIAAIASYKFDCAGQSCNAPSRVYVQEAIFERFVARFMEVASSIGVGDGLDVATEMGPLAHERRLAAVQRLIADAVARGAHVLTGGERLPRPGYFFPPTILVDVPDDAAMMTEEPFGPMLPISRFATLEDAVERANRNPYGLAAYAFTRSPETAARVSCALAAGSVGINVLRGVAPDAPVGGIRDSGYGYEGGIAGIDAFLNLKLVSVSE